MSGDKESARDAVRFKNMLNRQENGKTIEWCVALLQVDGGMTQDELYEVARGTRAEANAAALRAIETWIAAGEAKAVPARDDLSRTPNFSLR